MTLEETLTQLEALGNEKMRAQNTKNGAGDNQFGVRLGDLRVLANKIKTNHELAIGETLGIYRDYPVSKGCTSPFAPIWINAMVSRQG